MHDISSYIPLDRRTALAQNKPLPEQVVGAVLFADISGFTRLTDTLAAAFGPRQGADALARYLNDVYTQLIAHVHAQGGSVIGFSGDAITCWFNTVDNLRTEEALSQSTQHAILAGAAMQETMQQFHNLEITADQFASLEIKTAVATDTTKRFLIGNPDIQVFDVLAGELLDRVAAAEQLAQRGDLILDEASTIHLSTNFSIHEWRTDPTTDQRFAVVAPSPIGSTRSAWEFTVGEAPRPQMQSAQTAVPHGSMDRESVGSMERALISEEQMRPWLPLTVYNRLATQQSNFVAELRPAVALLIKFSGINFDDDPTAGEKLNAYIHWVQRILARYEATLIQVTTGDKGSYLYAAFGAPTTHGDDADRAVAAALDLCTPPDSLAYIAETQIGISQGRMRVGAYGSPSRQTYGVLGEATPFAARLMTKAEPGQILIGDEMAELVREQFHLQDMGLAEFKGKVEPLPYFVVVQRRARVAGQYASVYAEPLVGRDDEIMSIEAILAEVVGARSAEDAVPRRSMERDDEVSRMGSALRLPKGDGEGERGGDGKGTPLRDHAATTEQMDVAGQKAPSAEDVVPRRSMDRDDESSLGRIVRIEGEAGVGKSHLAAAVLQSADEYGMQVVVGTCGSTSGDVAYYSLRQVLRVLLGLTAESGLATDDVEEQVAQVTAQVERMNAEWTLRLPLLGDLLGVPIADNATTAAFDPQLRQQALTALALDILQQRAMEQPLLLLFEDVHWMDEASQNVVLGLARTIRAAPILLMLVHRPTLRDVRARDHVVETGDKAHVDGVGQAHAGGTSDLVANPFLSEVADLPHQLFLKLGELSADGTGALVEQRLFGTVSPLALAVIRSQAQGNPFFVEELVDTLQEMGRLVPPSGGSDGVWTLSESMVKTLAGAGLLVRRGGELVLRADVAGVGLGLPDSVHGLVLSRLDRLPEAEKLTLKVAGVIGRSFEFELLRAAHPAAPDEGALLGQVGRLIERGFARLESREPQLSYSFRHNITQEVAYCTLLEQQRQDLHFAVAQCVERLQPESVERLAHHFSNGDLGRAPVRAGALRYLGAAGDRARRDYANETALSYYDRGLAVDPRWGWLKSKADVLHLMGRREEEELVLRLLDGAGDADPVVRGLAWGEFYEATSDFAAAREVVVSAQDAGAGDVAVQARCLSKLGIIAWREGDYDAAQSAYEEALAQVGSELGFAAEEAELSYGLGLVFRERGDYDGARALFERALVINREVGNRREEARMLSALGILAWREKDFDEAIAQQNRALEIQQTIGDWSGVGATLYSTAQTESDLGDYAEAKERLEAALEIHLSSNNKWQQAVVHSQLVVTYMLVGEWDKATEQVYRGLKLCNEMGAELLSAYITCNLGQIQREQGYFFESEKTLLSGLAMAESSGDQYLAAIYIGELAAIDLENQVFERAIARSMNNMEFYSAQNSIHYATDDISRLALIYSNLKNKAKAIQYANQAMIILDGSEGEGIDYAHRDYFRCFQIFSANGESEHATQALESARRLLKAKADRISDGEMRRSFLQNVSFNSEIQREAERVLGVDS